MAPDGTLVLASGSSLLRFAPPNGGLDSIDDLDRYGVTRVEGIAIDSRAGTLLTIDADADQLLEIARADLGL